MKRTAMILLALLTIAGAAQAMVVSPKVGPLLRQVLDLIDAKNYKAAQAILDEAEAVKISADDAAVINQLRHAIQIKTLVCSPGERYRVIDKMVVPCPQP
jgi:hypothetical protein